MRKTSGLPKTLKTFLLSLAVSDLGVGLLVKPFYVARLITCATSGNYIYHELNIFTYITEFFSSLFLCASLFGVTAMSTDRFLAIHLHLRYQELVTHKRVVAAVLMIWTFSFLFSLLLVLDYFWLKYAGRIVLTVTFGCCIICTTIIYFKIYLAVRRHRKVIQVLQLTHGGGTTMNAAKLRRSAISTFYIYLVFLLCYLPWYCVYIWGFSAVKQTTRFRTSVIYTLTLLFFNSSLNPVVYCWKMRHIRQSIICILRNIFRR